MAAIRQADFVEQRRRARRRIAHAGDLHRHRTFSNAVSDGIR